MKGSLYMGVAAAMVGAFLVCSIQRDRDTDSRPWGTAEQLGELARRNDLSVLFVLVDTLRADRLGSYGYARSTSPNLDALAASGIRFANHMAQSSWTKTSMASLWTSLYPARTQVLRYSDAIDPDATLASEIFQGASFRTVGIWRNGWVAQNFGFAQGFDVYHSPKGRSIPPELRRENPSMGKHAGSDEDLLAAAFEFLRSFGDERWFLYLHMMDVHEYVYDETSALFGTTYSDIYDNSIHRMDRAIGALLQELERRGLRERTVVVVAADHGEAFGEHRREGHARDLYGEVTFTPWVIALPFRLSTGIVVQAPTENIDIWPTILHLLGLPALRHADGRSRVQEIERAARGEVGNGSAPRFAQLDQTWGRDQAEPRPLVTVTEDRFRLIHTVKHRDRAELYDLTQDPREQRNLSAEHPKVLARMLDQADAYLGRAETPWGRGAPQVHVDELQLNQLRALGYAIE